MVMWWVEYFLTEDLQLFSFSIKAGWMDEPPQPKHDALQKPSQQME